MNPTIKPNVANGFANNMSTLLNKAERKLGLKMLSLPPEIGKAEWQKVIVEDSLMTFSRYFPKRMRYPINPQITPHRDNVYFIDEQFVQNNVIIGVADIDWSSFGQSNGYYPDSGYVEDAFAQMAGYSFEDVMTLQMQADMYSLTNNRVFVDYEPPNQVKFTGITNKNLVGSFRQFDIFILVKHDPSLVTISQTKMETFEDLCYADIAQFVIDNLKYVEDNNVVFAQLKLHLDDLRRFADRRDDIVNTLKEAQVSASNPSSPIMITF